MANEISKVLQKKKSKKNLYYLIVSIILVATFGFLIVRSIYFLINNADKILDVNTGTLEKKKEFDLNTLEQIKQKKLLQ